MTQILFFYFFLVLWIKFISYKTNRLQLLNFMYRAEFMGRSRFKMGIRYPWSCQAWHPWLHWFWKQGNDYHLHQDGLPPWPSYVLPSPCLQSHSPYQTHKQIFTWFIMKKKKAETELIHDFKMTGISWCNESYKRISPLPNVCISCYLRVTAKEVGRHHVPSTFSQYRQC